MQKKHEWEERYEQKKTPWDTGRPNNQLMRLIATWPKCGGRVLEVGCGTGTNAVWLAQQGLQVTGVDISSKAIELSQQRAEQYGVKCSFAAVDFLAQQPSGGPFSLIFDRGCFHCMGTIERRSLFVQQAAACLEPDGLWFSLIGNSDQQVEGQGPPRLSAAQICASVEPAFEVLRLESCFFDASNNPPELLRFWQCLMRVRKACHPPARTVQ